jgi:hypothetical protein
MVPGFVGFDALGKLAYYAGVTQEFGAWAERRGVAGDIHYFDNFPTAGIEARSKRLEGYLLKRFARGELSRNDRVALVGHSTGGLDIRRMVRSLLEKSKDVDAVDEDTGVKYSDVMACIQRLVFLSVPHYGTNLADAGSRYKSTIQGLIGEALTGLERRHFPVAPLRRLLVSDWAKTPSGVLAAVVDAVNESDEKQAKGRPYDEAMAREARSQFALWLEHMTDDFSALEDLRSPRAGLSGEQSPAHSTPAERHDEVLHLRSHGIHTRSYATTIQRKPSLAEAFLDAVVPWLNSPPKPVDFVAGKAVHVGGTIVTLPILGALLNVLKPQLLFEFFQSLCADGPFARPTDDSAARSGTHLFANKTIETGTIDLWASDGVVNTLSMCWPHDPERPDAHSLFFVDADHADVIGHYTWTKALDPRPSGRSYLAYDLFESDPHFTREHFTALWSHAFDFCRA